MLHQLPPSLPHQPSNPKPPLLYAFSYFQILAFNIPAVHLHFQCLSSLVLSFQSIGISFSMHVTRHTFLYQSIYYLYIIPQSLFFFLQDLIPLFNPPYIYIFCFCPITMTLSCPSIALPKVYLVWFNAINWISHHPFIQVIIIPVLSI